MKKVTGYLLFLRQKRFLVNGEDSINESNIPHH